MALVIVKHFEFEAAHQLPNMPCYGKCSNMHGHTYKLDVAIERLPDEDGSNSLVDTDKWWVTNFSDLKAIVQKKIISRMDHQFLNESLNIPVSTAENIVLWIHAELIEPLKEINCKIKYIRLYETSNSWVEFLL